MTEEIHLAHLPAELALYVSCFTDVKNASFLKQQLLAGNQEYNYAFIDATTIMSRKHLLTGCFRALNDYTHDRLKSNNVQSEIVFCLSPNNNIGDAFKRFGIQDSSTCLIVVKVGHANGISQTSVNQHLITAIEGTQVAFTDTWLGQICDLDRMRKTYKITKQQSGKNTKTVNGDQAADEKEKEALEMQVLGLMALRGAT